MIDQKVYGFLVDFAKKKGVGDSITYKQLVKECQLRMLPRSSQLAHILTEISVFEKINGRPLLPVLVCNGRRKGQAKGFTIPLPNFSENT